MGRNRTIAQYTSDTDVNTVDTTLYSVVLKTDGTNAADVDVYDGTVAAGTIVQSLNAPGAGPSAIWMGAANLPSGLGLDLTGTGATVSVEYDETEF